MSTSLVPIPGVAQSAVLFAARTAGRVAGPFLAPFRGPLRVLISWPVTSQLGARHNALLAEQELADRRTEREDVQRYLAEQAAKQAEPAAKQAEPAAKRAEQTAVPRPRTAAERERVSAWSA